MGMNNTRFRRRFMAFMVIIATWNGTESLNFYTKKNMATSIEISGNGMVKIITGDSTAMLSKACSQVTSHLGLRDTVSLMRRGAPKMLVDVALCFLW